MFAAFANRRFTAYLLAAASADSGYWIAQIAQGWLVLKLTNSPLWLGLVASVSELPFLLFSLAGGRLADRFNRRLLVAGNNAAMAAVATCTALLVAGGAISVGLLAALGFFAGTLVALEHPVDRAWLFDLVEGRQLGRSIALSSLEWATARTFGPAIGGLAIGFIGIAAAFAASAACVVPLIVLALSVRTTNSRVGEDAPARAGNRAAPHSLVLFSVFTGVFTIGITPYQALLPDLAKNTFGLDAGGYGALAAAGGAGAMIGAVGLALRGEVRYKGRAATVAAVLGALLLLAFTHTHARATGFAVAVAMGAVDMLMYALGNTYVQEIASDKERGRANAIFSIAFLGAIPLGEGALGVLAGRFGTPTVLSWSAAGVAAFAIAFWFTFPQTRDAA